MVIEMKCFVCGHEHVTHSCVQCWIETGCYVCNFKERINERDRMKENKYNLKPVDMADISLVTLKNNYPHCKKHGAMNKVTKEGIWRCLSTWRFVDAERSKVDYNPCRAGCLVGD